MRETDEQMCLRHLREQEPRIRKQAALVTRLRAAGCDTVQAERLLSNFQDLHEMTKAHHRRREHAILFRSSGAPHQSRSRNKLDHPREGVVDDKSTSPVISDRRISLLLAHMNRFTFQRPPKHIGLKTMIAARDAGLIDLGPDLRKPVGRLRAIA